MSYLENKIEANDRTVREILENQKYVVDYYQREYNWEQSHIEQLVTDLCNAFLENYQPSHQRPDVENYNSYYLGPIIISTKGNQKSIIDGQQRLTSLTLFIIYLNNLQKEWGISENIETMVFSERYGQKSFNLNVPEREACLDALFNHGAYEVPDGADASTRNMAARYLDIGDAFSEEITQEVLPAFLDWLREKVVLVEIIAYSDENAYTIFETMNDRGLNLTPTEMLKGFLLSKFRDDDQRRAANDLWKRLVDELQAYDKTEDLTFFQAFLRAKYAETIRAGQAGSVNEDFEKIGTRFHNWVRENLHKMGLHQSDETGFHELVFGDINYYQKAYCRILDAEQNLNKELEHVYYISRWGIAKSLSYPLLLAPVTKEDTTIIANQKINLVAKYIDNFCVRRSVNFRNFAASSIRYTMYNLVREIRNMPLDALHDLLASKIAEMDEQLNGIAKFRMHGQNGYFIRYFLSRMAAYIDQLAGKSSDFITYFSAPNGRPYEIEHLWGNVYERHRDEFEAQSEFEEFRNHLGGLVLLPKGTNQSYSNRPYEEKLLHYVKENLLTSSLNPLTYENNPNFTRLITEHNLNFKPHPEMKKADINERQALYEQIAKQIWTMSS